MKEKALARPGGKLLCFLRIKWSLLYAAEGDLNGYVPALLQGEHEASVHPSAATFPGEIEESTYVNLRETFHGINVHNLKWNACSAVFQRGWDANQSWSRSCAWILPPARRPDGCECFCIHVYIYMHIEMYTMGLLWRTGVPNFWVWNPIYAIDFVFYSREGRSVSLIFG